MLGPLFDNQMSFRVASARDCARCQKWAKSEGFVAFPKTMAGVGHLKRMLGGPGADFLRGVAFWSLRSSSLLNDFE